MDIGSQNLEVKNQPECFVCHEPYSSRDRSPQVLFCGHTMCLGCVTRLQKGEQGEEKRVECPLCQVPQGFVPNYQLMEVISVAAPVRGPSSVCQEHNKEALFYCEQCEGVACASCVGHEHKGHPLEELKEVVETKVSLAQQKENQVRERVEALRRKQDEIITLLQRMETDEKRSLQAITESHQQVVDAARRRADLLSNELTSTIQQRQQRLSALQQQVVAELEALNQLPAGNFSGADGDVVSLLASCGKFLAAAHDIKESKELDQKINAELVARQDSSFQDRIERLCNVSHQVSRALQLEADVLLEPQERRQQPRQNSSSEFSWGPSPHWRSELIDVIGTRTAVRGPASGRWHSVMSSRPLSAGMGQKMTSSFEVRIDRLGQEENMLVGVCESLPPVGYHVGERSGFSYRSCGNLYNEGRGVNKRAAPAFRTGDIIRITIDFRGKRISFYKNGVLVGVQFQTNATPLNYRPCVTLHNPDDKVTLL